MRDIALAAIIVLTGLVLRLYPAATTYLNPDEAVQMLLAEGSWREVLHNSLQVTHPPLLISLTHVALLMGRSELVLRLVPVLAGSLFPVLLALWLWKVAGKTAALAALLLLTLSPHVIEISAQLRSYTPALLFLSASLLVLEMALEKDRWTWMAGFSLLLWLCILSDYSMAWFAGAVGVYCLMRLKGSAGSVKAAWAAGQVVAVALYGLLFTIQVRSLRGAGEEAYFVRGADGKPVSEVAFAVSTWLSGAFPHPGENGMFLFKNTIQQFAYLLGSVAAGAGALMLFAGSVMFLWRGKTRIERSKARPLAVLLVLPFLLNIAGAYAKLFPYGYSRHTLVLGLFAACGIAVFVEGLPQRAALAILWGALLLTPLWQAKADADPQNIGSARNGKKLMLECLDYMRSAIPADTLIFTERETLYELAGYESHHGVPLPPGRPGFTESTLGRWRVATSDYTYLTRDGYEAGLREFRQHYGIGESEPVWVLDGGWEAVAGPVDQDRAFTKAIRVLRAGSR